MDRKPKKLIKKLLPILIVAVLAIILKLLPDPKPPITIPDGELQVHFIDVGQADCALILQGEQAMLIDADATPIWQGTLTYRGAVASDIIVYKNALWAAYGECNVLLRYNLLNMREELRIGGNKSPFDKPRDLFIDGDTVMVSNQGSKKLVEVNLNTYSVFEYEEFEEPLYQYIKVGDNRFAVLESGLYLI